MRGAHPFAEAANTVEQMADNAAHLPSQSRIRMQRPCLQAWMIFPLLMSLRWSAAGADEAGVEVTTVILSRNILVPKKRRKTEMSWRFTLLPDSAAQLPERSGWNRERHSRHQLARKVIVSVKCDREQDSHSV